MEHVCRLNDPWPVGHPLPPVDPAKLSGPEVGQLCLYKSGVDDSITVVEVVERSYVWSPGECRHKGGYRRYDWSVINRGRGRIVVNDEDLTPLLVGWEVNTNA